MSTNNHTDAAIINLKDSKKALALTVDCNSRYVFAHAETGAAIAVAEAARNITCSGGEPSAITNCLNFGNPYNPEVYWQFVHAIKGMGAACEKFKTPVTGGNVSFYNQSEIDGNIIPVYPTPTIGMLGVLKDKRNLMTLNFKEKGDKIYLIGASHNDISSSQYLANYHKVEFSPCPYFNLDEEYDLHQLIKKFIKEKLINSAHDVSEGGLFVTLMESAMAGNMGFSVNTDADIRKDAFLFGESQGRIVVTINDEMESEFLEMAIESNIEFLHLGEVILNEIRIDGEYFFNINEACAIYDTALELRLN